MSTRSFALSADLGEKRKTLEVLAEGVYALTAEGDANIGAIEGEDFLVCFEALAAPVVAAEWLTELREHTDKPIRYLVLSHYHAVRVLGASAFGADPGGPGSSAATARCSGGAPGGARRRRVAQGP